MEFLSLTNEAPTLSQLAAGIGRSRNEIFRMMIVLEERGYIQRIDGEIYALTEKLALVGSTRSDTAKLAALAEPYLEQLSDETALSNHLAILQGNTLRTIVATDAASSYGLSVRVGYEHPVFGTAAGACFIAGESDQTERQKRAAGIAAGQSAEAFEAFAALIETCRTSAFAEAPNPEHNAIMEIAAPLRQAIDNATIAAISIPLIKSAESPNRLPEITDRLLATCRSLQERISIALPGRLQLS